MSTTDNPHKLGEMPVGKLLLEYSIPAIIGMTLTSLYNIIDSVFIGHGVNAMALSGLAISFPLMNLVFAFCTLVSAGGSTISSIRLGQKDLPGTTSVLGNTLMLCVINALFIGVISLFFLNDILIYFGASAQTLPYARDFMRIILIGTPISYIMIGLNNIMRATGYPRKAMWTSLLSILANLILAPIFILWFHGGIEGAAIATLISQFIAMLFVLHHFLQRSTYIRLERDFWKMRLRIVRSIFSIGIAPFLMNVCACVIVVFINNSLQRHGGDMAIGAFGIINRLVTLYVMIVLGLTMGMQPVVGYNYGAMKMQRVRQALRLTIFAGVAITSSGFVISELFPHAIATLFTDNQELVEYASVGLRYAIAMFPLVGAQIVITNFFQSIGKAQISICLSLSRQLIFLLPFILLLPPKYGIIGVWSSMPISDFLAGITSVAVLIIYFKRLFKRKIL